MKCAKCGANVSETAKFCNSCGAPVGNQQPALNAEKEYSAGVKLALAAACVAVFIVVNIILGTVNLGAFSLTGKIIDNFQSGYSDSASDEEEDSGNTDNSGDGSGGEETAVKYHEIDEETIHGIVSPYTSSTQYSVYVKNLTTGNEYGYNEHVRMPSSALTYMSIIASLGSYIDENNYDIDQETIYFSYEPNGREMPNSKYHDGEYRSIREYVEAVCTYGDNNCANYLVDYMGNFNAYEGFDYINGWLKDEGFGNTNVNRKIVIDASKIDNSAKPNETTAHDICNIFKKMLFDNELGNESYMKSICKYRDQKDYYGLQKVYGSRFTVANHNVANNYSSNEVAYISDGNTEIIIAVMALTDDINEKDEYRYDAIKAIAEYIVDSQF